MRQYAVSSNKNIKEHLRNALDFNITFYAYAKNYYELYKIKKIGEKTQIEYGSALEKFKEHFNLPFRSLRADDFQRFLNKIEEEYPISALKLFNKIKNI